MASLASITAAEILAVSGSVPDLAPLTTLCNSALSLPSPPDRWRQLLATLPSRLPFDLLHLLYKKSYQDAPPPHPAYFPSDAVVAKSNCLAFCRYLGLPVDGDSFAAIYRYSIANREAFWTKVIAFLGIKFEQPPSRIFDLSQGLARVQYLPDSRLNIVTSCFQAKNTAVAIRFQKENGADEMFEWTYRTLGELVDRIAAALTTMGLGPGAAVAIFMQMTAESVAAYLGIIKAGMVAVSVADSFSAEEIHVRLALAKCQAVLTQDYIYRAGKRLSMYERVRQANWPEARVVVLPGEFQGAQAQGTPIQCQLAGADDLSWDAFLALGDAGSAAVTFEPVSGPAQTNINILFSSGTTGTPKAIPWTHASALKAAMDGCLHHDIKEGECIVWPTNFGWMMAPWLVFATFINRGTVGLFYGSPVSREFCRFVERSRTAMLGMIPSITKQIRHLNLLDGISWENVTRYSSTGESSSPVDQFWLMSQRNGFAAVIEYCGGTEIGGGYLSASVTQPQAPSWFSTVSPSIELFFIGDEDEAEMALGGPSLGLSNTILNQDHYKVYYEGMPAMPNGQPMRRHGDRIRREGGYYRAMGRADDTMNLGGIKVSSVQLENVCSMNPNVDVCAAVAVPPPEGGPDQLVVFVVVKNGAGRDVVALRDAFQKLIKEHLNPLFKVHDVRVIEKMPMTATGKILRRELRSLYKGQSKL